VIWTSSKKKGVAKKCILLYVNINHKKCDTLQEALALLISAEKSHCSCWNYRRPQRPHHHVFSKQEKPEFWPTNRATPITKTTIGSAFLLWRRPPYEERKTPVCKMLQDRKKDLTGWVASKQASRLWASNKTRLIKLKVCPTIQCATEAKTDSP